MTTFVVAGNATLSHPAERGIVRISVALTSRERAAVSRAAIEAHNVVSSEAAAHFESGAATWWTADQVATSAYQEYVKDNDATVTHYRSTSQVSVTFKDFAVMATWVGRLAEWPSVHVDGIEWLLTTEKQTSLEREVRIKAVQDALTKAADYASALDRGSPTLDAVFEEGLRPHVAGGGSPFARDAMLMKSAVSDGAGVPDLKPRDIDVSASISADFTM